MTRSSNGRPIMGRCLSSRIPGHGVMIVVARDRDVSHPPWLAQARDVREFRASLLPGIGRTILLILWMTFTWSSGLGKLPHVPGRLRLSSAARSVVRARAVQPPGSP
jgi:hypothetical protein